MISQDPADAPLSAPPLPSNTIELSVVLPCLNEADTLGVCLEKILRVFREQKIDGEIVVADNGSHDGSQTIAESLGARVVAVPLRGYGNALKGGIQASRGRYVIMGDADDSYNFLEIPKFVEKLREGNDLVQGCRLPAGGGQVLPGAMPFSHRWLGNPMFTLMVRHMFGAPIHDVYCGLRGFTRALYEKLELRSPGMEFATEMIIKSSLQKVKIAEVPITLHPDGRKSHPPHLKTFRDGWRTLRFFLMHSPRWLFLYPGMVLILLGLLGYGLSLPGLTVNGVRFDVHTLLCSSLAILLGFQSINFAVVARMYSAIQGFLPSSGLLRQASRLANLERGLVAGTTSLLCGLSLLFAAVLFWRESGFGPLDYPRTMRWVIPGVTLSSLGFQAMLSSFLIGIMNMAQDDSD